MGQPLEQGSSKSRQPPDSVLLSQLHEQIQFKLSSKKKTTKKNPPLIAMKHETHRMEQLTLLKGENIVIHYINIHKRPSTKGKNSL